MIKRFLKRFLKGKTAICPQAKPLKPKKALYFSGLNGWFDCWKKAEENAWACEKFKGKSEKNKKRKQGGENRRFFQRPQYKNHSWRNQSSGTWNFENQKVKKMLFNKTKRKKIIEKTRMAKTFFQKFLGLMFESRKNFNYGLVFFLHEESKINATIHMLFVFFPIDVVYLNKRKKAVDIVRNLKPFSLSCTPKKPAKYFIELPAGKAKNISIGNRLEWK